MEPKPFRSDLVMSWMMMLRAQIEQQGYILHDRIELKKLRDGLWWGYRPSDGPGIPNTWEVWDDPFKEGQGVFADADKHGIEDAIRTFYEIKNAPNAYSLLKPWMDNEAARKKSQKFADEMAKGNTSIYGKL